MDKLRMTISNIVIIAFAIMVVGTLSIPTVLAMLFSWQWLLAYPGCLILFILIALKKSRRGK